MTGEQKQAIAKLRRQGLGYRKIAAQLDMSENTVKAHIQRNGVDPQPPVAVVDMTSGTCQQCGANMSKTEGRKGRKFCSEACRRAWWKTHSELKARRAWYSCFCAGCGKKFKAYGNSTRKYCGRTCYMNDRYGGERDDRRTV